MAITKEGTTNPPITASINMDDFVISSSVWSVMYFLVKENMRKRKDIGNVRKRNIKGMKTSASRMTTTNAHVEKRVFLSEFSATS